MFSNGMEYMNFNEEFCCRCNKYKPEGTEKEECCPIEYQISLAGFSGEKKEFPYEDLKPIDNCCIYACKSFESNDKELMEAYKKFMEE